MYYTEESTIIAIVFSCGIYHIIVVKFC